MLHRLYRNFNITQNAIVAINKTIRLRLQKVLREAKHLRRDIAINELEAIGGLMLHAVIAKVFDRIIKAAVDLCKSRHSKWISLSDILFARLAEEISPEWIKKKFF